MEQISFDELQTGDIFNFDNTPSYPKLKTDYGYIDMRDEIKKDTEDVSPNWTVFKMSLAEVVESINNNLHIDENNMTEDDVIEWRSKLLKN